jgi:hypothetical protein
MPADTPASDRWPLVLECRNRMEGRAQSSGTSARDVPGGSGGRPAQAPRRSRHAREWYACTGTAHVLGHMSTHTEVSET